MIHSLSSAGNNIVDLIFDIKNICYGIDFNINAAPMYGQSFGFARVIFERVLNFSQYQKSAIFLNKQSYFLEAGKVIQVFYFNSNISCLSSSHFTLAGVIVTKFHARNIKATSADFHWEAVCCFSIS